MKKTMALYVLCTVMLFSCGDDNDDDGGSISAELIGTWSSTEFSRTNCTFSEDNATCNTAGCMTITFSVDGRYNGAFPDALLMGTVTSNETNLELCTPEGDCTDVSYTLVAGTLIATWVDSEDGCTYNVSMTQ